MVRTDAAIFGTVLVFNKKYLFKASHIQDTSSHAYIRLLDFGILLFRQPTPELGPLQAEF